MILNDHQRDALLEEITTAIKNDVRTSLLFDSELEKGRSKLFAICRRDYQEQRDAMEYRRPFYIQDKRGTFGFVRLRDKNDRVLGYKDGDAMTDTADMNYKPMPDDRETISSLISQGEKLYCYISEELATMTGVLLTSYTKPAVYEYERKRHRVFNLFDPSPNNSAIYIALYESYNTQFLDAYDLPTLPAGTNARREYYTRLLRKAADGKITFAHVRRFDHGKGTRPPSWGDGNDAIIQIGNAIAYNTFVGLNGRGLISKSENEVDATTKYDSTLFSGAIR